MSETLSKQKQTNYSPLANSLLLSVLCVFTAVFCIADFAHAAEEEITCKVTAKVIDADTGKPVPGAAYYVMTYVERKSNRQEAVSDKDGIISLTVPQNAQLTFSILPLKSGKLLYDMEWMTPKRMTYMRIPPVTADKDDIELKVKLIPTRKLTGTVLDSKGEPAADAKITYSRYIKEMKTDEKGRFVFPNAPADRDYDLYVVSEDGSEASFLTVPKSISRFRMSLAPTKSIEGKTVDEEGNPAPELNFRASLMVNGSSIMLKPSSYTADKNGKFTIENICEGAKLYASWYSSSRANMNYWQGNATVKLESGKEPVIQARRFLDDWQAKGNIAISEETKCKQLSNYCLDSDDNILACDEADKVIRKISPEDKLLETWKLDFGPQAIDCKPDGTVIVGGRGKIALLDKSGKVICQNDIEGSAVSGIGFSNDDIFAAVRVRTSFAIVRMDNKLQQQKVIVTKLSGCCGQFDISARDGYVYAAANTKFKIYKYDRDGNIVLEMGEKGNTVEEGFAGCCEPKNVCFDQKGNLFASESGNCCVKKFSEDGKSFEMIGKVNGIRGCVRVAIAVNSKGDKVYMLDTGRNIIRCLPVPGNAAAK